MVEPLINHLWQSTLCVVAAALLTLAFRKNGANVRFLIWLAASAKFLIPFSLIFWIGTHFRWEAGPTVHAGGRFPVVMDQIARPAKLITTNLAATPLAHGTIHGHWSAWTLVASIWLLGSLALICFRLFQSLYLLAVTKASSPVDLRAPIPVHETISRLEPGLFGIFSPTLLLPTGLAMHLTPAQLDAILVHELCHWRRRDNLTAALHMIVEALFWFHPLVWWLGRRLLVERERACDEAVIQSGTDRQVYAEGILKICQHYVAAPACSAGVSSGSLRKRIEEIMTTPALRKLPMAKRYLLGVVAFVAVAAPLAVGVGGGAATVQAAEASAVEMKHYRNSEWSFELDVPKGWIRMPPVPMNSTNEVVRFWSTGNGHQGLIIFRNYFFDEKSPSLEQFLDRTKRSLAKSGFSNFISGETTIGSRRVMTLDFQSRPDAHGSITYCRHYLLIDGRLGYVLGFGATTKSDAMFDLFDRMAKSFVFEES